MPHSPHAHIQADDEAAGQCMIANARSMIIPDIPRRRRSASSCLHICATLVLWCLFCPCVCNVVITAVFAGKGVPEAEMQMQVEQLLHEADLFVLTFHLYLVIYVLVSRHLCECCCDALRRKRGLVDSV